MKNIFLALALFLAAPAHADEAVPTASLFFTSDEAARIEALAEKTAPVEADPSDIRLGAVLYYGPQDWTLWLQGQKWTPASDQPDLHVIAVQPGEVRLSWISAAKDSPREITLHPHQTYQTATGAVVEGMR